MQVGPGTPWGDAGWVHCEIAPRATMLCRKRSLRVRRNKQVRQEAQRSTQEVRMLREHDEELKGWHDYSKNPGANLTYHISPPAQKHYFNNYLKPKVDNLLSKL